MFKHSRDVVLACALAVFLAGCASLPDTSDRTVNRLLLEHGAPAIDSNGANADAAQPKEWMSEPMTAERAVQVALTHSPRLQQEYARIGLARADILEAVQVGNPRLSLTRLNLQDSIGSQRLVGLAMPLADLLTLPVRARLAAQDYERVKRNIAAAILDVDADVEATWYRAVGAEQVADMRAAAAEGADVSADLAQRFFDAGNISELQLNLQQASASEARIAAARAKADSMRARLELDTLIGLSGSDADWKPSDRLPAPVPREDDPTALARLARDGNLQLQAAQQEVAVLQQAGGLTRGLRWLGASEIGYERETETDGSRIKGPRLGLELPIFNQGQAKVARVDALLAQSRARLAQAQIAVDNGVRLGAERVRILREVVDTHRESLVPQREIVVARSQEEQNFMLIGVFELLQAKAKEIDAYQGYLEAVRDYWLARVELMRVVGSRLPSDAQIAAQAPSVQEILVPPADQGMHGQGMRGMQMQPDTHADPASSHPAPVTQPALSKPHHRHGAQP